MGSLRVRDESLGVAMFLVVTFALSWLPAWLLDGAWQTSTQPTSTRLLHASLAYAAVLGWQPVLAIIVARAWFDRRTLADHGLHPVRFRFLLLAIVAPMALLVSAAGLDWLLWNGGDTGHHARVASFSATAAASAALALVAIVAVVWLQAFSEELGWRGYLLQGLMRRFGGWAGLLIHGAFWGLWYAPVFLIGGGDDSVQRMASFVVTCALLGTLLGWLRLASGSVFVSAAANAVLTLGAGLPIVLQGASSSRTAIYEPTGWIPMAGLLLVIATVSSARTAITSRRANTLDHVN